jgi:hypothetical protein
VPAVALARLAQIGAKEPGSYALQESLRILIVEVHDDGLVRTRVIPGPPMERAADDLIKSSLDHSRKCTG